MRRYACVCIRVCRPCFHRTVNCTSPFDLHVLIRVGPGIRRPLDQIVRVLVPGLGSNETRALRHHPTM